MAKGKKDNAMIEEVKRCIGTLSKDLRSEMSTLGNELRSEMEGVKRHTGVLVEGLRSEVKLVFEQHGDIIRKLEDHDRRFDEIDIRFDRVDLEFKGMKTALFDNSHRLDAHETKIRKLELRN